MPSLQLLHPTFLRPEELLACDEAMLDFAEQSDHPGFLRFFEADRHFVVLGYSKKLQDEVHEEECRALHIPILRRCSGGGTVLQGPGCLNYSLVLPIDSRPGLDTITGANRTIMEQNRAALAALLNTRVTVEGHSDLAIDGVKFSGNAQRRKRRCLLFHGSILLNFDLQLVARVLKEPAQRPAYRADRPHAAFIRNVPLTSSAVAAGLAAAWNATEGDREILQPILADTRRLAEKYQQNEWNRRA